MTLRGHSEAVSALAWSPDGSRLVSAAESTVILWDMTVGRPSILLQHWFLELIDPSGKIKMGVQLAYLPETHHDTVSQVQWISNEAGFVTAAMDQKIVTWVSRFVLDLLTYTVGCLTRVSNHHVRRETESSSRHYPPDLCGYSTLWCQRISIGS
jgi:WD40 repeat protein